MGVLAHPVREAIPAAGVLATNAMAYDYSQSPAYQEYAGIITDTAKRYGIPNALFGALLSSESNFDPYAKNVDKRGLFYRGIGQISDANAAAFGINSYDPQQNIDAAGRILSGFLNKYRGNVRDAVAAYKGGLNPAAYAEADKLFTRYGIDPGSGINTADPISSPPSTVTPVGATNVDTQALSEWIQGTGSIFKVLGSGTSLLVGAVATTLIIVGIRRLIDAGSK